MTDDHTNNTTGPVALADIVRLKEPYKGFTMGIVAEILDVLPNGTVRTVSLYLYNPDSKQLYITPTGVTEICRLSSLRFCVVQAGDRSRV